MSLKVNCHAGFTFQVDVQTIVASTGEVAAPVAGAITGLLLRLSATPTGDALDIAVNDLPVSERTGTAARFFYQAIPSLLEAHVLPLGRNASFYAIWYRAGELDMYYAHYRVADRTEVE